MKVIWSESRDKSAQIKHSLQKKKRARNSSKQICGWILMWETAGDGLFHWRKRYYGLWIHVLARNKGLKFKSLKDGFVSYKHAASHVTDGLVWITCGLLWCIISCLDSHSDGTHSLQSIHCWASDGMTHVPKSDEEINSSTSWTAWGRVHFQQIFIFRKTTPLKLPSVFWMR